jgi:hypothetical protein
MGEAKKRKAEASLQPQVEEVLLTRQMTLPQRVLENASKGMDGFWRVAEALRQKPTIIEGSTGPWNSWSYLPVNAVVGIVAHLYRDQMTPLEVERVWMHKCRLLTAVSAWRMTKGVYVFDPEVAKALAESEVEEDLPDELFLQLPDWCPYISTPGLKLKEGLVIHGFFAYVDDRAHGNRQFHPPELNFEILVDPHLSSEEALGSSVIGDAEIQAALMPELQEGTLDVKGLIARVVELAREREYAHMHMNIPLGQGKFSKAFLEQTRNLGVADPGNPLASALTDENTAEDMLELTRFFGMMQARLGALLLYLVSDKADISPEGDQTVTRSRITTNERRGIRNFQAPKIKPWEVGFRIGAEIRAFEERNKEAAEHLGTGTAMRPHVRRAHWHSFWTGPRDQPQQRRKRVRWLPPTPVNVSHSDDLVPTMHKVVTK